ncbi:YdcF family protein [Thauera sp. Sel9]|uniref:YdcF family protein n=1 Tax=Thauera sp. Sel9 TaxID=2974299 RepID=UPI0021E1228C|nr:YdcF family protein [Thauera sp. Sel9]MCV2218757.1 YdcF family protein [Thauera sp. Sel9]
MDLSLLLFSLKKLAAAFALPPLLPLLPIALGLAMLGRFPRLGRTLGWSGLALGLLLSTPASVNWLAAQVEDPAPLPPDAARNADAIVILGAGRRSYAPEFGGETVNRLALERLRYGAHLARATGLPILVSGGGAAGKTPEAVLMKAALEEDFGLAVQWVEERSRDTRENARYASAILDTTGMRRILLVTHAAHMPRAQAEFEAAGLIVQPAPTAWLVDHGEQAAEHSMLAELPNPNSAYAGWFALHEALGRLAYRLSR